MLTIRDLEEYVDGRRNPGLTAGDQWDLAAARNDLLREWPDASSHDLLDDPADYELLGATDAVLQRHMRHVVEGSAKVMWSDADKGMDARNMFICYDLSHDDENGQYTGIVDESFSVHHLPLRYTRDQISEAQLSEIMAGDLFDRGWDKATPWVTKSGEWMFAAVEHLTLTCESDPTLAMRSRRSCSLTAAQAQDWHAGVLDARSLSDLARSRLGAHVDDLVTLRLGPEYPPYGWFDSSVELYRLEVGHEREAMPVDTDSPFIAYGWKPDQSVSGQTSVCDPADPVSFDVAQTSVVTR